MSYSLAFLLSLDSEDTLTDLGSTAACTFTSCFARRVGTQYFSTCTAQWKCLGDMWAIFLARRLYSNHMLKEVSLSPVLSQPWLGHQISSSSLTGVVQHHHFLPQPSLPLQFLQVEISSTPAPYRQIPSGFHSGINRKRGGHVPEP